MQSKKVHSLLCAAIVVGALFVALIGTPANAEDRKIKTRVNPAYPELAKRMNATGTVRLEVQVAPSGDVKGVKVIGGHPLLVNAAEDAVKKWKYEPASEMTTTIVEFKFSPGM